MTALLHRSTIWLVMASALIAGCSPSGNDADKAHRGIVLLYDEQEAGIEPYPVRILVSPGYVRIDDGFEQSDFVLLDRPARTVFSVSHSEKNILVIDHEDGDSTLPAGIELGLEKDIDDSAPLIAGRHPVHFRFTANGSVCFEAVVVPELLPEAGRGLIEYGQVLAGQQRADLEKTPGDLQTPCFLSRYVYAPTRELEQGLPIQEWDDAGYRRVLTDYLEDEALDGGLFELPEGYARFMIN